MIFTVSVCFPTPPLSQQFLVHSENTSDPYISIQSDPLWNKIIKTITKQYSFISIVIVQIVACHWLLRCTVPKTSCSPGEAGSSFVELMMWVAQLFPSDKASDVTGRAPSAGPPALCAATEYEWICTVCCMSTGFRVRFIYICIIHW